MIYDKINFQSENKRGKKTRRAKQKITTRRKQLQKTKETWINKINRHNYRIPKCPSANTENKTIQEWLTWVRGKKEVFIKKWHISIKIQKGRAKTI